MWNKPTQEDLAKLPPYRNADNTAPENIIIWTHFFLFDWHWYIATYEPTHRVFFGYANLGDDDCAEWGPIPLQELEELNTKGYEVERDVHWQPVRFGETLEGQKYQRGIQIWIPIKGKKDDAPSIEEVQSDEEEKPAFIIGTVFDISQTEPQDGAGDPKHKRPENTNL